MKNTTITRRWFVTNLDTKKRRAFPSWETAQKFRLGKPGNWLIDREQVGPKFKGRLKTVDLSVLRWWDKVNGNSYFAGTITLNFGMPNECTLHMPFQYGSGSQPEFEASKVLQWAGIKFAGRGIQWECRESKVVYRFKERDAKQAELKHISKFLEQEGRDY